MSALGVVKSGFQRGGQERRGCGLNGLRSVVFLLMISCWGVAHGADRYIYSGAIGAANGSDWTNAWTNWPSTFVRGDTYYVADGSYGAAKVGTAVSGTSVIKILKATKASHGTGVGWSDSMGDGQAVIQGAGGLAALVDIYTSYVTFDGVVNGGSDPAGYGFYAKHSLNCATDNYLIGIPGIGHSKISMSNVTVKNVAMVNCGSAYPQYTQVGVYSLPLSGSGLVITGNYLDASSSNVLIRNWADGEISHNFFNGNWSDATYNHGQQISPANSHRVSLFGNIFEDSTIFVIGAHNEGGGNSGWNIYNNVVVRGTDMSAVWAMAESGESDGVLGWNVHHNTHVNLSCGGRGALFTGTVTDPVAGRSYFYNNVFYNTDNCRLDNPDKTQNTISHTHNAHFNSTGVYDGDEGGTAQAVSGSPLKNVSANDYSLAYQTLPGRVLGPPFDRDHTGMPRAHFDRGAFEYSGKVPASTILQGVPTGE